VLATHAFARAFLALGGSPWAIERALAVASLLAAAWCAPLTASLARRLGIDDRGAFVAGLVVALSPIAAHTFGAVLTEGPSLALALAALVVAHSSSTRARRSALLAGVLVGAAFGVREQAIWAVPAVLIAIGRRQRVTHAALALACALLVAAVPTIWFAATQPGWTDRFPIWIGGMLRERESHRLGLHDVLVNAKWIAALGPAAVVLAAVGIGAGRLRLFHPRAETAPILAIALAALGSLLLYPDLATHPRYMAHAIPGAIALPAGWAIANVARLRALDLRIVGVALALPVLVAGPFVSTRQRALVAACAELPARLASLPARARLVTGQPCAALPLHRALARIDRTSVRPPPPAVCAGWAWPRDLRAELDDAAARGETIVVDGREAAWTPAQRAEQEAALAYAAENADRVVVWR